MLNIEVGKITEFVIKQIRNFNSFIDMKTGPNNEIIIYKYLNLQLVTIIIIV